MDQRVLAGLGNIYVAEALHRGGLHPARAAHSLSRGEVERLAAAIGDALRFALSLEEGPQPVAHFEERGDNEFLVYGHEGGPCRGCAGRIERIVQGGRSTFLCPRCQPAGRARRKRPALRQGRQKR